jgi:hypothetical protein
MSGEEGRRGRERKASAGSGGAGVDEGVEDEVAVSS